MRRLVLTVLVLGLTLVNSTSLKPKAHVTKPQNSPKDVSNIAKFWRNFGSSNQFSTDGMKLMKSRLQKSVDIQGSENMKKVNSGNKAGHNSNEKAPITVNNYAKIARKVEDHSMTKRSADFGFHHSGHSHGHGGYGKHHGGHGHSHVDTAMAMEATENIMEAMGMVTVVMESTMSTKWKSDQLILDFIMVDTVMAMEAMSTKWKSDQLILDFIMVDTVMAMEAMSTKWKSDQLILDFIMVDTVMAMEAMVSIMEGMAMAMAATENIMEAMGMVTVVMESTMVGMENIMEDMVATGNIMEDMDMVAMENIMVDMGMDMGAMENIMDITKGTSLFPTKFMKLRVEYWILSCVTLDQQIAIGT
ncbi:hypothetical protein TCAL_15226 [Tigriopus californicus]|uniref:Uncharacterized protein n=1 Tax=Tigriopus californicus TaxID=6832 RepID=A0A553NEI8_TIGCA|nr:hypothetical protein TCAL_15226 [Tigriopus californicus]